MGKSKSLPKGLRKEPWAGLTPSKSVPPSTHAKRGVFTGRATITPVPTMGTVFHGSTISMSWLEDIFDDPMPELPKGPTLAELEAQLRAGKRTGSKEIYEFNEALGF